MPRDGPFGYGYLWWIAYRGVVDAVIAAKVKVSE